jgi:hypothetical protein
MTAPCRLGRKHAVKRSNGRPKGNFCFAQTCEPCRAQRGDCLEIARHNRAKMPMRRTSRSARLLTRFCPVPSAMATRCSNSFAIAACET